MAESMPESESPGRGKPSSPGQLFAAIVLGLFVVVGIYMVTSPSQEDLEKQFAAELAAQATNQAATEVLEPRSIEHSNFTNVWHHEYVLWWDDVPAGFRQNAVNTGTNSNVRHSDYVGSDSCRDCHRSNHDAWSLHGHHRMTQFASAKTVVGDFSGKQTIEYDGGSARFFTKDGEYHMELKRGGKTWLYRITRTIGWRHMQDYAGFLVSDHDELGLDRHQVEHVLPFAWDVAEQHFMPPVHVHPDDDIPDSFEPHMSVPYSQACSDCHNAYPVGDRMFRRAGIERWAAYAPRQTSMFLSAYLSDAHPEVMAGGKAYADYRNDEVVQIATQIRDLKLEETVVLQGITCEACHYGCRDHVEKSTPEKSESLPAFYPVSPHLVTEAGDQAVLNGKTPENINFICARCHSGSRQSYANGLQAWNSTEYTEAMNGHCYDPVKAKAHGMQAMSCAHCHEPHETVGLKWARTPQQDDAKCLSCHQQFNDSKTRVAHTHHASGDGSHCMDCHMPHTNEGLGRMVRTHRIVNPIDRDLIEANQVNACNLCHLDKSIDWTLKYLNEWYDPNFKVSEEAMARYYVSRKEPVVHEWMKSDHAPTRIATAGAIARRKAVFALPDLLDQLTVEEYGYNQRAMQKAVDEILGIKIRDKGFHYYAPVAKRKAIMEQLKPELLKLSAGLPAAGKPVAAR